MRISDWSSDVCSSDLQQFIRLCHVEDGGVAVYFSGILNGVEIRDGCPNVAIPGIRGYIIEQSMVLGIFADNGVCFQLQSHFRVRTMPVTMDFGPGQASRNVEKAEDFHWIGRSEIVVHHYLGDWYNEIGRAHV